MSHSHPSPASNIVGVHYRVGKKIGEGSFGVIFEGACVCFVFCVLGFGGRGERENGVLMWF